MLAVIQMLREDCPLPIHPFLLSLPEFVLPLLKPATLLAVARGIRAASVTWTDRAANASHMCYPLNTANVHRLHWVIRLSAVSLRLGHYGQCERISGKSLWRTCVVTESPYTPAVWIHTEIRWRRHCRVDSVEVITGAYAHSSLYVRKTERGPYRQTTLLDDCVCRGDVTSPTAVYRINCGRRWATVRVGRRAAATTPNSAHSQWAAIHITKCDGVKRWTLLFLLVVHWNEES